MLVGFPFLRENLGILPYQIPKALGRYFRYIEPKPCYFLGPTREAINLISAGGVTIVQSADTHTTTI